MTNLCGMPIDWNATGAMMSGIGTIGGAGIAAVAAVVGFDTFTNWKAQKIAERHMSHAETILTAAYRAQYNLIELRNPFISGLEWKAAEKTLQETTTYDNWEPPRQKRAVTTQVYIKRVNDTSEGRLALYKALPVAKAFWPEPMERSIRKLHDQFVLFLDYAIENDRHDYDADDAASVQRRQRIHDALYYNAEQQNDEIGTNIREAMAVIEATCLPALGTSAD